MARVISPLMQWPRWRHSYTAFRRLLCFHSSSPRASNICPLSIFSISFRGVHFRSRSSLRLGDVPSRSVPDVSDDVSTTDNSIVKKSRNEKKREAHRAVRWGMELASFSPSQIKRILRVAALEQEVYDAVVLVKRLDRDVREGKRRQFNYMGRLLRDVEPELMDGLIQATKDGDHSKFRNIPGAETSDTSDEDEDKEEIAEEYDEEDSVNMAVATRWSDGLVNKDMSITNDIYSLQGVEFDRQELRRLVRNMHSTTLEDDCSLEENSKSHASAVNARKLLNRFLFNLVKQLPAE